MSKSLGIKKNIEELELEVAQLRLERNAVQTQIEIRESKIERLKEFLK
jgi:hypothetical protein